MDKIIRSRFEFEEVPHLEGLILWCIFYFIYFFFYLFIYLKFFNYWLVLSFNTTPHSPFPPRHPLRAWAPGSTGQKRGTNTNTGKMVANHCVPTQKYELLIKATHFGLFS